MSDDEPRFADAIEALARYGTPRADLVEIVEMLAEFNDDRAHMRSAEIMAKDTLKIIRLVAALDPT